MAYTETGKRQTSFTLVCTEAGKTGEFKAFIPVLVVGGNAEPLAESLEPGDLVLSKAVSPIPKARRKNPAASKSSALACRA
jgi:hypothetical protein